MTPTLQMRATRPWALSVGWLVEHGFGLKRRPWPTRPWALTGCLLLAALASPLAHSQSACSNDGQPAPGVLFERFINADCAACWRDPATPTAPPDALALDWIVPGSQGDDAALAAASSSDALARLAELQRLRPATQDHQASAVTAWPGAALRLAHGTAVGNYIGVLISLSVPQSASLALPLTGWVVLLEALPSGTEASPVPRYLVRNALQPLWDKREQLSNQDRLSFSETRAMSFPNSAQAGRLRLAGWVQDAKGRILTAALSACPAEDKD